jgi:hypothetical protein
MPSSCHAVPQSPLGPGRLELQDKRFSRRLPQIRVSAEERAAIIAYLKQTSAQ